MAMPKSRSRVLSRNGLRPRGAALRRRGGGTARADAGDRGSVTATIVVERLLSPLVFRAQQILELVHELAHVAEGSINRGKADVRDLVQPLQLLHHDPANFFGAHFL